MDLALDASDSNKRPADCLSESPQTPLLEQIPKIADDQSIDVTTEGTEHPVEDEKTKPKTLRIHPSCKTIFGIGRFYHLNTADVKFIFDVDGNKEMVPAHKCMLAFHSPVFRQMFYGELKEKGDIKLTDTTVEAFIKFLKSMYDFQLTIKGSQSEIEPLLELAHKYDVNWVEKGCQWILDEVIKENAIAILWVLPLANLYSYEDMRQKCIDTIHAHGNFIIESDEFVDCEMEIMKDILDIGFVGRNETKVFEMCIKWAERACKKAGLDAASPENIRKQLGDYFDLIRFDSMTQEQFLKCLSINLVVFTPQEIEQYATKLTQSISQNESCRSKQVATVKLFELPFNSVKSSLQQIFQDQSTADVTFVFKNDANEETERIPAHKCILARRSPFFANRFRNKTKSNDEIIITGVSSEVFTYFLRLMYVVFGHQILAILKEIDDQHIDALLTLNVKYLEKCLSDYNNLYTKHLIDSLNEQNVIGRLELSRKHSLDKVKTKCVDLMKEKGEQMINSEAFMDCSQENLKTILELGIWNDEKSLIDACIKWAEKYCKENQLDAAIPYDLRTVFGDAFGLIPFSKMGPLEFINFHHDYKGLLTSDEIVQVIEGMAHR